MLALPGGQPQAGSPATIDAGGTKIAPGTHIVAFEWDMNGDGHVDTNTGTNPIAHVMTGAAAQTVIVHATDSNFNRSTRRRSSCSPGRSPAGCVPEESIGVLRIRAACIRHEGTPSSPTRSRRSATGRTSSSASTASRSSRATRTRR